MGRTKAKKKDLKASKALEARIEARRLNSKPRAEVRRPPAKPPPAPKPYLRVPEDYLIQEGQNAELPKADSLFKKHLFNQSRVNGW